MQHMERGGRTGACPWWEGVWALPPPLENEKKEAIRGNINLFHYTLLMKLGGGGSACMQHGRGWAGRRVSMVWGGGPRPPRNWKKRDCQRKF